MQSPKPLLLEYLALKPKPNLKVQSGPDATSSNVVTGGLQITQPRIATTLGFYHFGVYALGFGLGFRVQFTVWDQDFQLEGGGVEHSGFMIFEFWVCGILRPVWGVAALVASPEPSTPDSSSCSQSSFPELLQCPVFSCRFTE